MILRVHAVQDIKRKWHDNVATAWRKLRTDLLSHHVVYVASKSNPADGPTREDWKLVSEVLKAEVMQADFPVWCWQLWGPLQVPFEFNT
jgi:hypothetical protein